MKNILFVIESLNCGGAEKSLVTLLNNLDFTQYKVDLLLTTKGGVFEKFVPEEVNIIYEDILSNFNSFTLFVARIKYWIFRKTDKNKSKHLSQHYWRAINKNINKNPKEYDVSIAYGQGFPTYYVAEKVNAKSNYSWLNTDHQKTGYNAEFDYYFYKKYNKIVAVSEESKASLNNAMASINKQLQIEIIKDISDKDQIIRLSQENTILDSRLSNTINILTVCRLEPIKGLHLAIKACEILKRKGKKIRWYVIGEGSEKVFLEKDIQEKNLKEHFILLGFKENPYPYMRACDIYVQTSLFEGLGLTVIEAAILCKPIVATNFPTASTIITHRQTGLIAEMDAQSISANISKYIEDSKFTNNIVDQLSLQKNNDKEESLNKFNNLILLGKV